ncbi:helix-turn-helix transcriptional regulator [Nocardia carnea]|uniref:helix-turn-helix transcriptional regulator n=1 Tax=Nocardia carnea TaxID=37328 RepID=UPI002456BF9E|nr:helix-turn-helix transcriptional regulator [Nocardia carnea]
MDRAELGTVLRAARSRLEPADVGLPAGRRRQVPGLRREEVAQLAGISVAYLTRLEQGRGPLPSIQVLGALATALRLGDNDRELIFHLAGSAPPPAAVVPRQVSPSVRTLLAHLADLPVLVLSAAGDVLAWNRLTSELLGDFGRLPPEGRNILRLRFLGGGLPRMTAESMRAIPAEHCVGSMRGALARYSGDRALARLVAELLAGSPEFERIWRAGTSRTLRSGTVTIDHPEFGPLTVHGDALRLPDTDQTVIIYTPAPGSAADAIFRRWRDHGEAPTTTPEAEPLRDTSVVRYETGFAGPESERGVSRTNGISRVVRF